MPDGHGVMEAGAQILVPIVVAGLGVLADSVGVGGQVNSVPPVTIC